jgi:thioesterase domain-containing protein
MDITKDSVVFYKYEETIDAGVIGRVEDHEYWSAWVNHYYDDSWCSLEHLTLIGPPILGVFNDEGN